MTNLSSLTTSGSKYEKTGSRPVAELFRQQLNDRTGLHLFLDVLDTVSDMLLVLNRHGRIVFANQRLYETLLLHPSQITGMSIEEALDCAYAEDASSVCGSHEWCQICRVARVIQSANLDDDPYIDEFRYERSDGTLLDLRISASPVVIANERYTIVTLQNESEEKRRRLLERIFFHDVLNLTGVVLGYADLLNMTERQDESEHAQRMLVQTTMRLVDEIQAHRALAAAETGELQVQPQSVAALELVHNIANAYSGYIVGRMREIEIVVDPASEDVMLESDAQLLERVLGNMVKNALEASKDGQKVTIGCYGADGHVYFTVHNESEIPPDVQAQIFQRAFSTKDIRRGLGTYSMKLLTERYLNGKVSFCSNKDHGTTFRVMYPVVLAAPQARGAA